MKVDVAVADLDLCVHDLGAGDLWCVKDELGRAGVVQRV